MLGEKKRSRHAAAVTLMVLVLVAALVVPEVAFAISGPPPPSIDVSLHFDYSTARGFEKEVEAMGGDYGSTPEFVLGRGKTGTMNVTFTAIKEDFAVMEKNATASITSVRYGDERAGEVSLPQGIFASVAAPKNITLPPDSSATVTLQISAAPDAVVRSHNLVVYVEFSTPSYPSGLGAGYSTVLTIVDEPASSSTSTTTTSSVITKMNGVVTKTETSAAISTTTQLSTITSTSTATERSADPSTYAWAVSATVATIVLAAILLLQRRRTK